MQIPEDIVQRWSSFVTDWCLGVEPVEAPTAVDRAFCTLRRLWPEYVNDIQEQGTRGIAIVASAVSLGLTLAACKPLKGFEPVMARVRQGENSALAELEFAAALVRSGLTPELEPQVRSRQLDCSVEVGSEIVFAEVIAPETSEAIRDAYAAIERVAVELVERSKGTHAEVLLTVEPDMKFDTIITSATATPPDETVHNVEGTGWVRRVSLASQPPEVAPQIPNPDPRPAVFTTRLRQEDDTITSAMVRLPILDERTHRLLSAELHHFSQAERNILVVRVTSVPGGMKWWLSLTQRWFQPTRNRRVGAVVLYETALIGTPSGVRQRWRIVENPYAYVPVPNELITAIGAVDESSVWSEDTGAV